MRDNITLSNRLHAGCKVAKFYRPILNMELRDGCSGNWPHGDAVCQSIFHQKNFKGF